MTGSMKWRCLVGGGVVAAAIATGMYFAGSVEREAVPASSGDDVYQTAPDVSPQSPEKISASAEIMPGKPDASGPAAQTGKAMIQTGATGAQSAVPDPQQTRGPPELTAENGGSSVSSRDGNDRVSAAAAQEGVVAPIRAVRDDPYASAPVLDERRGVSGPEGRNHNIKVVKASFKYPLVRVDEAVVRDPETGKERVVARTEMVADHIVVKLQEGTTEEDLRALNEKYGAKILRKMRTPGPGTYLVQLSKADVDAAPDAVAAYGKEAGTLAYAEPDYIVHTMGTVPNDPSFDRLWGMKNTGQCVVRSSVSVGVNTVQSYPFVYSGTTSESGITTNVYYCGKGKTAADFPAEVSGTIALISRDDITDNPKTTFATKVANAMNAGAVAAIIMNSDPSGVFKGTLGSAGNWIPAVSVSMESGNYIWDRGVNNGMPVTVATLGGRAGADIHATEAWDLAVGGTNVLVGVIDTGIDYTHPDLASNIDPRGRNFVADNNDAKDDFFHGTHCAGTIGAIGNNTVGVAGVNWNVSMVPLKFLSSNGSGATSDAAEAVYYATSIGVILTSNSWGGGGQEQTLKDAIADAGAHGILFVAAAGNSAGDNDEMPIYPASYGLSNIIAVAAMDARDELAYFSCYGAKSVHLGAPGVDIYSTYPTYMTEAMTARGFTTNYETISGTSMATPHVAGVCALVKSYAPGISGQDLKYVILETADPVPALAGMTVTGGRLNARSALEAAANPWFKIKTNGLVWDDDTAGGSNGNSDGYVNPGERIGLTVPLRNGGLVAADGVTAQLLCADSNITVVADTVSFGAIAAKGEVTPAVQFLFDVRPNVETPHPVTFTLAITDAAGHSRQENFAVTVYTSSTISGHVTKDGSPLAGATVKASGPVVRSATSAGDGSYSMTVTDGSYSLTARYDGFYDAQVSATTPPDRAVDFAFTTETISGRVLDDATGSPVPGATVTYFGAFAGSVTSDAGGSYAISGVFGRAGIIRLQARLSADGVDYVSRRICVTLPPSVVNFDLRLARRQTPYYRLIPLAAANCAYGVNSLGQVLGGTGAGHSSSGNSKAWIWQAGNFTYIPFPGDWSYDSAYSICAPSGLNDKGHAVGYMSAFFYHEAFLWRDGLAMRLGFPPGAIGSQAAAINNNGLVAGAAEITGDGGRRPAVWQPDLTSKMISKLGGCAFGVNNSGQVVGDVIDEYGNHRAFRWQDGVMSYLGGAYTYAFSINAAGEVIGCNGDCHAVLYGGGSVVDLHNDALWNAMYPLYGRSQAVSLNNLGDAVGWAYAKTYGIVDLTIMPMGDGMAVLWKDGRMYALKDQVVNLDGWALKSAQSINDDGWIAGLGDKGPFVLVPTSAPPAAVSVTPPAVSVTGYMVPGESVTASLRIANDGSQFRQVLEWSLMHDMGNTTNAGKVLRELPDAGYAYGCAFDGNVLWLCGWDGTSHTTLRKVNPDTGAIIGTLDISGACSNPESIAWDGQHLWVLDILSSVRAAVCIDPATGAKLASIPTPNRSSVAPVAITWGDGALWIATLASDGSNTPDKIHKVDPQTGNVLATINVPQVVKDTGGINNGGFRTLAYANGQLWLPMCPYFAVQSWPRVGFKLDALTGNLLGKFPLPDDGQFFSAMSSDGNGNFWLGKTGGNNALSFFLVSGGTSQGNWMYAHTTNGCTDYPVIGATSAGGSIDVTLAFDPRTAGVGVHTGTVSIVSNDPVNPEVRIPVTFTVGARSCTIAAMAGTGGMITPSGTVVVPFGSNQTFAIAANAGWGIADVTVDGVSRGAVASCTVSNVTENHTIAASFAALTDLILHLNLDDGSGTNAVDSSGYGNNGTLVNGPVWTAGTIGGAVQFDGINDYIVANNLAANTASGGCNTVAFWMKWNGANNQIPFRWNGTKPGQFWFYGGFGINTANGELLGIDSTGLSGNWVHVVGVFPNGMPTPATAKIYINGVLQTLTYRVGSACKEMAASPQVTISSSVGTCYGGAIDDLRIYNRELTAEEVAALAGGNGTNHAPVAQDGYARTRAGSPVTLTLSATDPDGDPLTYSIIGADSSGGTVSGLSSNRVTYTPKAGFTGTDHFHFEAWDAQTNSALAQFTILVRPMPRIDRFGAAGAGDLGLWWSQATNGVYIDMSPTLTPTTQWQVVAGPLESVTNWSFVVPTDQTRGYYRIRAP